MDVVKEYVEKIKELREEHKKHFAIGSWEDEDIDNLLAALAERNKELTAATKIVESQEAQIMRLAQEKEQAESDINNARKVLWTSHGHEALYGDDGEMQCAECMPHYDYKNEPLHHLIANVLRNAREQAEARVKDVTELHRRAANALNAYKETEELTLKNHIKDLESRLDIACHVKADDKVGFDFAVLDKLDKVEDLESRLSIAREGLEAICKHLIMVSGGLVQQSIVYNIAKQTLERMGKQ